MTQMLIRHTVRDFAKWKPAYDAHRSARQAAGLRDLHLWRNVDNQNDVFVLFEVSDVAKAKSFAASPDLKQAMTNAGVTGAPDIVFLSGD